jgi:hypothetical protein
MQAWLFVHERFRWEVALSADQKPAPARIRLQCKRLRGCAASGAVKPLDERKLARLSQG